jgi:hypothetical protein
LPEEEFTFDYNGKCDGSQSLDLEKAKVEIKKDSDLLYFINSVFGIGI